jgi:uncharacterized membrane protein YozB (DUF420 family)
MAEGTPTPFRRGTSSGLKKWLEDSIPGWLLWLVIGVVVVGMIQDGALTAGVLKFVGALNTLLPALQQLVAMFSLTILVVGVFLYHFVWHDKVSGHGRKMMVASFVGMAVLGLGFALIPHLPDMTKSIGNVSWQAFSSGLAGTVRALGSSGQ